MVMEPLPEVDMTDFDYGKADLDLNFPTISEYTEKTQISPAPSGDSPSVACPLEPIPHSISITTQYVRDLFELLQSSEYRQYQLSAEFNNEEATTENGVPGFNVLLELKCKPTDVKLKEFRPAGGCFPNRRLAKEAASRLAIEWLKLFTEELTSLPPVVDASLKVEDSLEETINWRGRLASFCQVGPNANQPTFTFFQAAQKYPTIFSCELTGIQGLDKMFGSRTRFYTSKKRACVQAAKEAMLYIEKHQIMPPEAAKKGEASAERRGSGGAPGPNFVGKVQPAAPGSTIVVPLRATIHETVTMVCPRLGLSLPEYKIDQDPETSSLYDITATIRRLPPRKGVRIGPIKGVYGRKNAKDTIAHSVLTFLRKEAEGRQVTINTDGS